MQEKLIICRMLPKYYPIINICTLYIPSTTKGWMMMGLLEYVYVDANEIVAFKLIGSKAFAIEFAKCVKTTLVFEENTC